MSIKTLMELLSSIERERVVSGKRYYAQDSNGYVNTFVEKPKRFSSNPMSWSGPDKTQIGLFPRFETWHQAIVIDNGINITKVPSDPIVNDIDKPGAKANLSLAFPERAFTGVSPDVEFAKTYFMKAEDAQKRNIKFDMNFADFAEIISNKVCCISGVELDITSEHNGPTKFSLDRLDPTLGYVKGNVVVMSSEINNLKSDLDKFLSCGLSDELLLKVIYKVENVLRKRIKKKKEAEAAVNEEQAVREASFKLRYGILPTSKGVK